MKPYGVSNSQHLRILTVLLEYIDLFQSQTISNIFGRGGLPLALHCPICYLKPSYSYKLYSYSS